MSKIKNIKRKEITEILEQLDIVSERTDNLKEWIKSEQAQGKQDVLEYCFLQPLFVENLRFIKQQIGFIQATLKWLRDYIR